MGRRWEGGLYFLSVERMHVNYFGHHVLFPWKKSSAKISTQPSNFQKLFFEGFPESCDEFCVTVTDKHLGNPFSRFSSSILELKMSSEKTIFVGRKFAIFRAYIHLIVLLLTKDSTV